jgi:hypothetical protein
MTIASGQSSVSYMNYKQSILWSRKVWKKLVTLQGCPTQLPGLTVCGAPAPEPTSVVTKEYEWSLGGITEDTYVTLTYTNPDGTTGGLSDY